MVEMVFSIVIALLSVLSQGLFQASGLSVNLNTPLRAKRATAEDHETILTSHNKYRSEAGAANMEYMQWSDELTTIASQWVSGCDEAVSDPSGISHSFNSTGRNYVIYEVDAGDSGTFDLEQAVLLWNLEKMHYNYTTATCTDGMQCEHYQQLVYASTTHVGCDYNLCSVSPVTILFGCYYGPSADLTVQPFTEGESCSQCTSGSFFCLIGCCIDTCDTNDADCECKAECENCGTPVEDTCSCECTAGFSGPTCSEGSGLGCDMTTPPEAVVTTTTPEETTTTPMMSTTEATTPALRDTTTEMVTTMTVTDEVTDADLVCPSDHCRNGGTPYLNNKKTRCKCECPEEYHGNKCKKQREEAEKGCEISVKVNLTLFEMIWMIFVRFLVSRLNVFCCLSVQSCCGGASISKAPFSYQFISTTDVVLGSGFPEVTGTKISFLYYVRAQPQNSLCSYAYSRGKRQAIEAIELPQDILQSIVEDAQDELAAEFEDCCNATITSIGPGQIYVDEDEEVEKSEVTGIPVFAIIAAVIVTVLFFVVLLLVYLITRSNKAVSEGAPPVWKQARRWTNMYNFGNQPTVSSGKPVYFMK